MEGEQQPWTNDEILQGNKLTNAYRASDRVSQYLIRRVAYRGDQSHAEIFFRVTLFKLFNKIETWKLLCRNLETGFPSWAEYGFDLYDKILSEAMAAGTPIYSMAYIIPPTPAFPGKRKHQTHLRLLEHMMTSELPQKLAASESMKEAFGHIKRYPMMGDFLSYQLLVDLNYSVLMGFSEMDFVVPGPGAQSGIKKCFSDLGGYSEAELIRVIAECQEEEFRKRELVFKDLWGRPLQLIDCQGLFCETDKYLRLSRPDVVGRGARKRIKQKYTTPKPPIEYWYPPKWGL